MLAGTGSLGITSAALAVWPRWKPSMCGWSALDMDPGFFCRPHVWKPISLWLREYACHRWVDSKRRCAPVARIEPASRADNSAGALSYKRMHHPTAVLLRLDHDVMSVVCCV